MDIDAIIGANLKHDRENEIDMLSKFVSEQSGVYSDGMAAQFAGFFLVYLYVSGYEDVRLDKMAEQVKIKSGDMNLEAAARILTRTGVIQMYDQRQPISVRLPSVKEDFVDALSYYPHMIEAATNLAFVYWWEGNYDLAEAMAEKSASMAAAENERASSLELAKTIKEAHMMESN